LVFLFIVILSQGGDYDGKDETDAKGIKDSKRKDANKEPEYAEAVIRQPPLYYSFRQIPHLRLSGTLYRDDYSRCSEETGCFEESLTAVLRRYF
jgi:hypothetical protein